MNPSDSSSVHTNKNSYNPREENEKHFGTVEGVQQGSSNYKIVQTKKLEPEILDCASASWHFNRDIRPIITKMERLSLSTGAWVLLLTHHTKLTSKLKQARVANSHSLMKELEAWT
ncbi:hypothetical protein BDQ17DRAFT_1335561 [Cyathus striatus]|nr:hypothetical protein BDQ17DRAFT_1335561 [Cyathus striatus]